MTHTPRQSVAKYLAGLTKEKGFMTLKGRTKTPTRYLVEYKNVYVPKKYDEQGNLIAKSSSARASQRTVGKIVGENNDLVTFSEAFLQEHPILRGEKVYVFDHQLCTYSVYLKLRRERAKDQTLEEQAQERLPEDSLTRTVGPGLVTYKLMQDLRYVDALIESMGKQTAKLFISLIQYMAMTGGAPFDKYQAFAEKNVIFGCQRWTSKQISEGLKKLTPSKIHDFWMALNRLTYRPGQLTAICFDSTAINTYADIPEAAYGHAKQDEGLPQVNLLCGVMAKTGMLAYSETYEGSIPDMRAFKHNLSNMANGVMDLSKVVLICDRGYKCNSNIDYAFRSGTNFVMAVKTGEKDVQAALEQKTKALTSFKAFNHAIRMHCESLHDEEFSYVDESGIKHSHKVNYFAYLNAEKANEERLGIQDAIHAYLEYKKANKPVQADVYNKVKPFLTKQGGTEVLDDAKIQKAYDQAGIFVLCTSLKVSAETVYELYQDRNHVEVFIDHLKNGIDARRLRHQADTYQGFLLLATLAAGIRMRMSRLLGQVTTVPAKTIPQLFAALSKIEVSYLDHTPTIDMVPKKTQTLLEKMGIYLDKLSEQYLNLKLPMN